MMNADARIFRFRNRILAIYMVGFSGFLVVFLVFTWMFYLVQEHMLLRVPLFSIPARLSAVQLQESEQMEVMLGMLSQRESLRRAWKNRQRSELQREIQPIMDVLKERLHITHLYFTNPDRVVFLRGHHPDRFGDVIDRFTTLEAQRTGKTASGLELGVMGTMTLRVVFPVHDEGRVIGFLEMGKEIATLLETISHGMGVRLHPFLDKKLLDHQNWSEGMHMLWRQGAWDRFAEVVHIGETPDYPPEMAKYIASNLWRRQEPGETIWAGITQHDDEPHFFAVPLRDVRQRQVGWLIGAQGHDVLRQTIEVYALGILLVTLLIGAVLFVALRRRLGTMEMRMWADHGKVVEVEESLALAQGVARMGNWDWRQGREIFLSQEVKRILGFSPTDPLPKGLRAILGTVHPLDRREVVRWVRRVRNGAEAEDREYRVQGRDGVLRYVRGSMRVFHEGGRMVRMLGTLHDVTEMRRMEESLRIATTTFDRAIQEQSQRYADLDREKKNLEALSLSDPLTGLGNRRFFEISLDNGIEYSRRKRQPFALLMIDLDGFKPVNDTLGHEAGDQLLKAVAHRMREQVRLSDHIYRIGGDEFAVLLPDPKDVGQVLTVSERICQALSQPFPVKGEVCHIGCSVGASLFPIHGENAVTLMERADLALYWIKRHGKGRGAIFDEERHGLHAASS